MSQTVLQAEWLKQLSDPYAVLGISVTADERQILKRYHAIAKLLHPDRYSKSNNNLDLLLAQAIFTKLINPAYERLKQAAKRATTIDTLRLEARYWSPKASLPQNSVAEELMKMSVKEAELVYEEAIASYAEAQYQSFTQSYQLTQNLRALNLAYLWLHKPEAVTFTSSVPMVFEVETQLETHKLDAATNIKPSAQSYAQRHYQRAIQYVKQTNWALAVRELRDAIKLEPNNSDYYALLGLVHCQQNFLGMAKIYTRQALKLDSQNTLALRCAARLKMNPNEQASPKSMGKALGIAALLSKLVFKAESESSQVVKFR